MATGSSEVSVSISNESSGFKIIDDSSESSFNVSVESDGFKTGIDNSEVNVITSVESDGFKTGIDNSENSIEIVTVEKGLKIIKSSSEAAVNIDDESAGRRESTTFVNVSADASGTKSVSGSSESTVESSNDGYGLMILPIPASREVKIRLIIKQTDDTWIDVSSYVLEGSVELGNVSQIGTGSQGGDSIVRTLGFSLQETSDSFSPLNKTSSWNQVDGSWSPLLWPNREVRFMAAIQEVENSEEKLGLTQVKEESLGDGTGVLETFDLYHTYILPDSQVVYLDGSEVSESNYIIDYDEGTLECSLTGEITIDYVYYAQLFGGYLGDSINPNPVRGTISVKARDYARKMQNAYIKTSNVYGNPHDGIGEAVVYVEVENDDTLPKGVLVGNVIQNIMNDHLDDPPTLRIIGSPTAIIRPYQVEYKTVFDATQELAFTIGWFLGYAWHDDTQAWEYTLMEPPRDKDSGNPDFALSADDAIYKEDLDINDDDVRNDVTIEYRDGATNQREFVNVVNDASITEFSRRSMLIGEDDASQIDTEEEALDFAYAALSDLKDLSSTNSLVIPLLPEAKLYTGIRLTNTTTSSTNDFYAVESVKHRFSIASGSGKSTLTTEMICSGTVKGKHSDWLMREIRPGSKNKVDEDRLYGNIPPAPAKNVESDFLGKDAIVTWDKPEEPDYKNTRVDVWTDVGDTNMRIRSEYVASTEYVYSYDKNKEDNNGFPKANIDIVLYHIDSTGNESLPYTEILSNPVPYNPEDLVLTSNAGEINISIDKPTETDIDYIEYQVSDTENFEEVNTLKESSNSVVMTAKEKIGMNYIRVRVVDVFDQKSEWVSDQIEVFSYTFMRSYKWEFVRVITKYITENFIGGQIASTNPNLLRYSEPVYFSYPSGFFTLGGDTHMPLSSIIRSVSNYIDGSKTTYNDAWTTFDIKAFVDENMITSLDWDDIETLVKHWIDTIAGSGNLVTKINTAYGKIRSDGNSNTLAPVYIPKIINQKYGSKDNILEATESIMQYAYSAFGNPTGIYLQLGGGRSGFIEAINYLYDLSIRVTIQMDDGTLTMTTKLVAPKIFTSPNEPDDTVGTEGDIWLKYEVPEEES